jgi:PKD repeat protein
VVYAATKGGLFKSTDDGATFTKVLGLGTGAGSEWVTDVVIAANGDLFAGCSSTGVYKSSHLLGAAQGDAGQWTKLITGFSGGFTRVQLAVAESDSNFIYALTSQGSNTDKVYRSTNGGTSWAATSTQPNGGAEFSNGQAWYDLCIAVDPADKNYVIVGAIDVYRTTNGGTSWSRITAVYGGPQPYIHPDQHGLYFRKGFSGDFVIANDGGIWFTMDNAVSYQERNNNYCVTQYYAMDIEQTAGSQVIIGGTQDNGSSRVSAPGVGPGDDLTGADGGYCNINYLRPDTMYTTTQWSTVLRSRNGGTSFSGISNPDLDETNTLFINPIEMDPNNPDFLYQASTRLWRHNNAGGGGGGGWVEDTKDYSSQITAIGISRSVPNLLYFAVGGQIYRYANAHAGNFTSDPPSVNPSGIPSGYVNCIAVDPNDGNHIIITYTSFSVTKKVMETRDANLGAAATWKDLTGNLPDMPVNWAIFEPGNPDGVLIGTDLGVFRCADIAVPESDVFWSPERQNLGMPRVNMIRRNYNDNTVHIATHGRGFFSTNSYNLAPLANFGIERDTVCGGAVQFVDSTENPATTWAWDFGDGGTSTSSNPVHVYAASGTYVVTMIVSNAMGTDTSSRTISIVVAPSAIATSMPDTSLCPGGSIMLLAGGGTTYSWSPALNLDDPNIATPTVTGLSGTRTYVVTVTNEYGCADTEAVKITVLSAPPVWAGPDKSVVSMGDSVLLEGTGGVTYTWTPTTGLSCTTCPQPKAYPAVTTTYTLTGIGANGCEASDNVKVTVAIVGIEDPVPDQGAWLFAVSPNPVTENATVSYRLSLRGDAALEVLDVRGRIVQVLGNGTQSAGMQTVPLDASALEAGIYFVRLRAEGQTFTQKFVVQR